MKKTPTAKELGCPFEIGEKVLVEAVIESIPEPGTLGWKLQMFTVTIPRREHGSLRRWKSMCAGNDAQEGTVRTMADQFNENAKDIIVRYVDAVGYLDGLIGEIAAALRAERERGIGSFQDQIRERLIRDYKLPDASIDGGGSASDHIDFTMAEIAQAVQQIEERAESRGFARGVRAAASLCVYPKLLGEDPNES